MYTHALLPICHIIVWFKEKHMSVLYQLDYNPGLTRRYGGFHREWPNLVTLPQRDKGEF